VATIVKPTPESIKLRELAKKVPLSKWVMPSLPEEVEQGQAPLSVISGSSTLGPTAMTRAEAIKPLLGLVKPGLSELAKQEIADSIRLILKGVPKKVFSSMNEFAIHPSEIIKKKGWTSSSGKSIPTEFGEHRGVSGVIWSKVGASLDDLNLKMKITPEASKSFSYSLPEAIAHETAHGAHARMAAKLGSKSKLYDEMEEINLEYAAEMLAKRMAEKADIPFGNKSWLSNERMKKIEESGKSPFQLLAKELKRRKKVK